jgi:hypothetical protein
MKCFEKIAVVARASRPCIPKLLISSCPLEIISLTPRFNAVNHAHVQEKPFKRFFSAHRLHTRLKPGVNEKFSARQFHLIANSQTGCLCHYLI